MSPEDPDWSYALPMLSSLPQDQRKELVRHYLETAWNVPEADEKSDALRQAATNDDHKHKHSCTRTPNSPPGIYLESEQCSRALEQVRKALRATFPDIIFTIIDLVAEGEKVAVRWIMRGTDLGGYKGYLPTGRSVSVTGMTIVRLEDYAIVEEWNEVDVAGMLHQLGFVYTPQSPRITVKRPRPINRPYE